MPFDAKVTQRAWIEPVASVVTEGGGEKNRVVNGERERRGVAVIVAAFIPRFSSSSFSSSVFGTRLESNPEA